MKTIKIRFVQEGVGADINHRIQKKKIFGFDNYRYSECGEEGDCFWHSYRGKDKVELLNKVLHDIYETTKDHVKVIEYPMLKIY